MTSVIKSSVCKAPGNLSRETLRHIPVI